MSSVRDRSTGRFTRPDTVPATPLSKCPSRVVAGGLVWRAEEDAGPSFGASIGFELAVRLGQAGPPDRGRQSP